MQTTDGIKPKNSYSEEPLTPIDYRFINYCREIRYGEIKVSIREGRPIIAKEGMKTRVLNIELLCDELNELAKNSHESEFKVKLNSNGNITLYEAEKKRFFNKIF